MELFRPALERLGAVPNASLADRRAGTGSARRPRGDATAPDDRARNGVPGARGRDRHGQRHALARHWARLRGVVRRHALLLVDGMLQREANVVNVIARDDPLARRRGGPSGGPSRRPAFDSSATQGCAGWADRASQRFWSAAGPRCAFWPLLLHASTPLSGRVGERTGTACSSRRTRRSRRRTAPTEDRLAERAGPVEVGRSA